MYYVLLFTIYNMIIYVYMHICTQSLSLYIYIYTHVYITIRGAVGSPFRDPTRFRGPAAIPNLVIYTYISYTYDLNTHTHNTYIPI